MGEESRLTDALRELLVSQRLAVLATQGDGQPYGSLVAFAATSDLKYLLFCTRRSTRKYRNLREDPRVAFLVDNRSNQDSDLQDATAVTATGRAEETTGAEKDRYVGVYLAKHPHLADFVRSPENALVRVEIEDYVIGGFRSVTTLRPD